MDSASKKNSSHAMTLSNGIHIPILGLGSSPFGGYSHNSAIYALKDASYRHIDTATFYGCEKELGDAIKESGIPRNEVFITTKLWPSHFGYEKAMEAFNESLEKLGTDYIDLYLVHWPVIPSFYEDKEGCLKYTWRAMEEIYYSGKCKAIGVSNYTVELLEELFTYCKVKPHVNQIEFHPFCYQKTLIEFCKKHNIAVEGYSPLVRMQFMEKEELRAPLEKIATNHNKSIAQVLIRWSLQHDVITIPKSVKKERLLENISVFDFELSNEEMQVMDALGKLGSIKTCTGPVL